MASCTQSLSYSFVIIGGGIAGVTCAETLALLNEKLDILLITKSEIVKTVTSLNHISKTIIEFDVNEVEAKTISHQHSNIKILVDEVVKLNYSSRAIETKNKLTVFFKKLCICTGGFAKLIDDCNPYIIGLRDTESVKDFENKIKSSRRVMVVGNGGIASEVIYEVQGIEKIWVIKDNHISKTFLDAGASEFFQNNLKKDSKSSTPILKRIEYKTFRIQKSEKTPAEVRNPALGPDWHRNFDLKGPSENFMVTIEYNTEVVNTELGDDQWPIYINLANGKQYGVDFVISATGVTPNSEIFVTNNEKLNISNEGGIIVNWKMETSLEDVFAAGDVCSAGWEWAPHWHQMKLWTQAQQMGSYSAKCMLASLNNEEVIQDFCFEIFSHVTKLYGYKVVLLGLFNGQKLDNNFEILLRMTKNKEYVKLVLKNGKLQGALLIGDTDLEEFCENLILNQLDLTPFGDDLLNPDIDIEDFFD